jgi:predicted RNA-binding protein associated with RNAse of E/G family
MKRKMFDLRPWARVTAHTQTQTTIPGYVILDFTAHTVVRPLDVPRPAGEGTVRILDDGFRWVRAHPTGTGEGVLGSALTVQLNETGRPVQFYVDIHTGEGVGEDGLPWHDDLYLDVIAEPQAGGWGVSATNIIDAEELEEAVRARLVTPELAEATWAQARAVAAELHAGTYAPLAVLRRYLENPYT